MGSGIPTPGMTWLDLAQDRVGSHHNEQFGDKSLLARALKLAEEAGEVAGAVIRHNEGRSNPLSESWWQRLVRFVLRRPQPVSESWDAEIKAEIGDVMIVLLALCDKQGYRLIEITRDSAIAFRNRSWDISNKSAEAHA